MPRIDIGKDIMNPRVVTATAQRFYGATDDPKTIRICSELKAAEEQKSCGELSEADYDKTKRKKKRRAWFYTPHAYFEKGYKSRKGKPVDSGKAIIDVDGCKNFRELYMQYLSGREKALGINAGYNSVSGSGGHVLFDIPEGLTRQEAQAWMAHEMGDVAYDHAVHDLERAIFIPCREYIIYIDEELMFGDELHPAKLSEEELKKWQGFKEKERLNNSTSVEEGDEEAEEVEEVEGVETPSYPTTYQGFQFSDILKKYWEVNNGGYEPTKGDRDTLTYQVACDFRHICNNNFGWLDQVIPCYDGFTLEEKRQKIRNALTSEYEAFPARLRNTLNALRKSKEADANEGQSPMTDWGSLPPVMPRKLPSLIKLLVSKIPSIYKPAVAHAVFPALATHLCQVRFVYTDNVEHEATLMNCLMAGTGAGKSCIDKPIERIMADIMRRDEVNLRREAEWKNDCKKKSANKEKPPRPEGLVIQIIDPDMTNPALVLRMDEAEGHFVYVKLNELELFDQLKGTGRQHFQLMCLAFDPGATYGQTRVGTDSVTARPQCRFNWNACTTIKMGRKYFRKVLTDGPISRINFCTIPEQEIGANQPKYGQYDAAFDEALKPYIDNLVGASGQINCPQAYKLIKKLQKECSDYASQSQSQTYWNLSHRACVIAWLKACVLYVANGFKWEREIDDFIRWSLNYDLWCKMRFFGAEIEQAEQGEDARIGSRGPKNMLALLPDKFTLEDVKSIRQKQGMSEEGTSKMVSQWKSRGYILQLTVDSFSKDIKYRNSA